MIGSGDTVSLSERGARGGAVQLHGATGFLHEAVFYAGADHGFVEETLPFVRRALAREAPTLVAVGPERGLALREALGDATERVSFLDMHAVGRNPARIIPVWSDFVEQHCWDGPALGIGEPVWPGRNAHELSECQRHDALLNLAFAGGPGWDLVCAYDLDRLGASVIEEAHRSHPYFARRGRSQRNGLCAQAPARPFEGTLPAPAASVRELRFDSEGLLRVRQLTGAWAEEEHLDTVGAEELVLAVNELATNSVRHGGGAGTLRMWRERDTLVCEVADRGTITDPLVGRVQPEPLAPSGRGVWIVNQLCDLVQIRAVAAGNVVRVHKRR